MKENMVYAGNIVISLAAMALVYFGKITWEMAAGLVAAMLMPSAAHVALMKEKPDAS